MKSTNPKAERLKAVKADMIKRINYEVLKMREYCLINQISNTDIEKICGLPASNVWRFLNRNSPEMTIVNFLLVAKGIGFEFSFTGPEKISKPKKSNRLKSDSGANG